MTFIARVVCACVFTLAVSVQAEPDGGTEATRPPAVAPMSALDAEARLLAGLSSTDAGVYFALEATPAWQAHANDLNAAWDKLETKRLEPMRTWAKSELWPRIDPTLPVTYFFGGPDVISVDVLYPNAPTLVLCGLERPGELITDLTALKPDAFDAALVSVRRTIRSTVDMSYFITSRMGGDMIKSPLKGVLPVLLLFLARNQEHPLEVHAVKIGKDGVAVDVDKPPDNAPGGWRVTFTHGPGAPVRQLYYLRLDLSNAAVSKTPEFFSFLEKLGRTNSFLKAASFIMHDRNFSKPRAHLLTQSDSVLEDDSGIPFKFLSTPEWKLTYFGTYTPPRGVFTPSLQPEMLKAWKAATTLPLPFSTGYKHSGGSSHLLLAVRAPPPEADAGVPSSSTSTPDAGH